MVFFWHHEDAIKPGERDDVVVPEEKRYKKRTKERSWVQIFVLFRNFVTYCISYPLETYIILLSMIAVHVVDGDYMITRRACYNAYLRTEPHCRWTSNHILKLTASIKPKKDWTFNHHFFIIEQIHTEITLLLLCVRVSVCLCPSQTTNNVSSRCSKSCLTGWVSRPINDSRRLQQAPYCTSWVAPLIWWT